MRNLTKGTVIERDKSIDLLKVIAIIGVVVIHTCIGGYTYAVGSRNWVESLFLGSLARASVPLFLMCSGALLLDPNKELGLKKLFSRNILRILAALFFWATAYKFFHLLVDRAFSMENIIQALKEVLLFKHESHLYFLHIILLVYVFLPVTRLFVKYAEKNLMEYALLLWFALGILYPTVRSFWPFTLLSGIPLQWLMNMTYAAMGYGLLGYYLKKYPLPWKNTYLLVGLSGFAFIFVGTWWMSFRQNSLYTHSLEGMTLGVALLAIGVFGLSTACISKFQDGKVFSLFTFEAKASFCIFLVHTFFSNIFSLVGFTVKFLPCLISIPVIVIVNLICSNCVYLILSNIPVVNEWLI